MWVQKISVTQTQEEKEAAAAVEVEKETIEKEIMSCAMLYAL